MPEFKIVYKISLSQRTLQCRNHETSEDGTLI